MDGILCDQRHSCLENVIAGTFGTVGTNETLETKIEISFTTENLRLWYHPFLLHFHN